MSHEWATWRPLGPILFGLSKSVQILPTNATFSDMLNLPALAAHDAIEDQAGSVAQAAE
jgi:phosphotransacetylase